MACMEHECSCGFIAFNNSAAPLYCPKCGKSLMHHYDESHEPDSYFDKRERQDEQEESESD